jgi:TRAP-type transport system large permease protein
MFMDITAALIILAPILAPLAINLGVHPLHFGIIMTINLNIGLMTPPLGACLYVACGVADMKLEDLSLAVSPFIIVQIIFLMIITFCPKLVMFVPEMLGFV